MAIENFNDRKITPTGPYDPRDVPKFGQFIETVKDVFARELKDFFDYNNKSLSNKLTEVPTIQKFSFGSTESNLETAVNLIMERSDTADKFPMVALSAVNVRERRMSIGGGFVASVQYPSRVEGSVSGPFSLRQEWNLIIKTRPMGTVESETTSLIEFRSILFFDILNATALEVADAINSQALYYHAEATSDGRIALVTGGPCARPWPNSIEIVGGTPECLVALGLVIGQKDSYLNTDNPPRNKYGMMADLTINIDVVSDDLNTRAELSDLIHDFFTFYMEKRAFQFVGRSYLDRSVTPEEWFHIILNGQFGWSAETAVYRPGGEQYDTMFANRGSVTVTMLDYLDRKIMEDPTFLDTCEIIATDDLPAGDYGGRDFTVGNS